LNRFDNIDCMIGMAEYPDKYFELAIVDPPYNVGASDGNFGGKLKAPSMVSGKIKAKNYTNHDKTPDKDYFDELFRVSKNQIIWGSNYYPQFLYHSGAVIWDKKNDNNHVLSDCEIAFQSFNKLVNIVRIAWGGFYKEDDREDYKYRVHPNQKPVRLYKWILTKYAKPNDKILDTHVGSASSLIACEDLGFEYVGFELDKDYYGAAQKRLENFRKQLKLAI
jgi:site-specific DNA-methyltransferase (adenine-specific)